MKALTDLEAPATVVRKRLEKDVQQQCIDWMRARGYWARKFSSMTQRSVPDYLFARGQTATHRAIKLAAEFKAPGKTSTPAQLDEQEAMRKAGWTVMGDCDNFEEFSGSVISLEDRHRIFG